MKCNKPITTLVHKHEKQTIKVKHKRKSKNSVKNLSAAFQAVIDPLENKVGVHE